MPTTVQAAECAGRWTTILCCSLPHLAWGLLASVIAAVPMHYMVQLMWELRWEDNHPYVASPGPQPMNWRPPLFGVLERLFYYWAFASGASALVVAWLAAKVFDQWRASEEDKKTFLMGSLLSLLHSVAAVLIANGIEVSATTAGVTAALIVGCDVLIIIWLRVFLRRKPERAAKLWAWIRVKTKLDNKGRL